MAWPAVAATCSDSPDPGASVLLSGSTSAVQRGMKTLCTVPTMCASSWESVRSPMRAWDSSNSRSDSSRASQRIDPGAAQFGDQLGHDEHDHGVDAQGDPVLRRPHREGVVRRQEEPVVGQEAGNRSDHARRESADHRADDRGDHQDQRGDRNAEVRAERQHQRDQAAKPARVTAIPRRLCWYVPLVTSLPGVTSVTAFCPSERLPSVPTQWQETAKGGDEHKGRGTKGSGRPVASACTWARRPASARRAPCSTRDGAASNAAPTSWSGSSRRTSGPTRWSRSAICRSSRASRSTTATRSGRRWTSTPSSPGGPKWPSSTNWPTPTCRARAGTRSGGRTCSRSSMRASPSSPP